ncbi:retrotransposon protein [Cucumis melo var. makuwa]|uniref:Retrotransposon protein n=1 Tax=Cucumis melo var. makuwa TaxID=1194695 RepID=A0A5A7UJ34_CUCMM|nr:retrotransposon protein [Cucumis melo var. makuwa]TYK28149.1 retrotransposon protein [Cucumis melo var. makuwa]
MPLLRTVVGLSLTEIVDVKEMIAMFLHVLAHDVKNRVMQREFNVTVIEATFYGPAELPWGIGWDIQKGECACSRMTFVQNAEGRNCYECTRRLRHERGFRICPCRFGRIRSRLTNSPGRPWPRKQTARYYYLCDVGYPNAEGFLAPYRDQRYHLKSYYPLQVQCHTILACCLLHNLINKEMVSCNDIDELDEGDSTYATTIAIEDIQ